MERWNSWILPLWLQAFFASMLISSVLWLPESPRWLYVNGREDEARDFITKYHGEGNENSVWVSLQLREYHEYLKIDGAVRNLRFLFSPLRRSLATSDLTN